MFLKEKHILCPFHVQFPGSDAIFFVSPVSYSWVHRRLFLPFLVLLQGQQVDPKGDEALEKLFTASGVIKHGLLENILLSTYKWCVYWKAQFIGVVFIEHIFFRVISQLAIEHGHL